MQLISEFGLKLKACQTETHISMHQTEKQVFCLNELKASYVELNFYPNTP